MPEIRFKIGETEPTVGNVMENIRKLDAHLACALLVNYGGSLKMIDIESYKAINVFKTYLVGVITDNKEMRIESLKSLKRMSDHLITLAKGFKKSWNEQESEHRCPSLNCGQHHE